MNLVELRQIGYSRSSISYLVKENLNERNLPEPRKHKKVMVSDKGVEPIPLHDYVRNVLKQWPEGSWERYAALREIYKRANGHVPKLHSLLEHEIDEALCQRSARSWKPVVWDMVEWHLSSHFRELHYAHVSEDDPTQIAFTPDVAKLLADKQVRMKPGRYLMKFFGPGSENPVLSEADVKYWADRQLAAAAPAKLHFIPNTDPDGWEWVYENGPLSCMRYNRDNRYLNGDLCGEDHPVRVYAHPENALALAFIMMDGREPDRDYEADFDEEVIAARAIVNTTSKTYHRVYAALDSDTFRSALREALEVNGYTRGSSVLEGQKLRLHRYGGNIVCPYLDGGYTNVEVYDDHLRVAEHGMDGQNSCGLIEDNRSVCDCCGDHVDEDDTTFVEWDERCVCSDCLDSHYTYAYMGRHQEWVPDSENLYRHRGNTYTSEGLDYADLRVCEECGEVVDNDDCVELHDGDYVCSDHAEECEVTGEWYLKDDMVDTEFDGRIAGEVAVKLHPSGEYGWKDLCYRLTTTGETFLWVHQDFMEGMDSDEFTAFFGVFSQALIPFSMQAQYGGFIERITEAFDPLNVRDGGDVSSTIEGVIESHIEVEDELELASPALMNKEIENERIAA